MKLTPGEEEAIGGEGESGKFEKMLEERKVARTKRHRSHRKARVNHPCRVLGGH